MSSLLWRDLKNDVYHDGNAHYGHVYNHPTWMEGDGDDDDDGDYDYAPAAPMEDDGDGDDDDDGDYDYAPAA